MTDYLLSAADLIDWEKVRQTPPEGWVHARPWSATHFIPYWVFAPAASPTAIRDAWRNYESVVGNVGTTVARGMDRRNALLDDTAHGGTNYVKRIRSWLRPQDDSSAAHRARGVVQLHELDELTLLIDAPGDILEIDPRAWCAPRPANHRERNWRQSNRMPSGIADNDDLMAFLLYANPPSSRPERDQALRDRRLQSQFARIRLIEALERARRSLDAEDYR